MTVEEVAAIINKLPTDERCAVVETSMEQIDLLVIRFRNRLIGFGEQTTTEIRGALTRWWIRRKDKLVASIAQSLLDLIRKYQPNANVTQEDMMIYLDTTAKDRGLDLNTPPMEFDHDSAGS